MSGSVPAARAISDILQGQAEDRRAEAEELMFRLRVYTAVKQGARALADLLAGRGDVFWRGGSVKRDDLHPDNEQLRLGQAVMMRWRR